MDAQQHDRIVRSIYDGVLAQEGWQPVLATLRELTGTEVLALLLWDERNDLSFVGEQSGADPMQGPEYETYYALDDPGKLYIAQTPVGGWYFDRRDLGAPTIAAHPFYQEFLRKYGVHSIMWTKLMCTDFVHAGLSFQGGTDRTPYSPDDVRVMETLLPHLARAMLLRWRFQDLSRTAQLGQQLLDRLLHPVLVIDAKARILYANEAARHWLSEKRHPFSHQSSLQQATPWPQLLHLANQICGDDAVPVGTLTLEDESGAPPTYLIGLPLREDHPLAQGWTKGTGIVVVHDTKKKIEPWPRLLQQLFGLTPAECRLVEHLANHHSLTRAAGMMNVSRETLRTQLKAVFQKTGSHNQSGLLQLISHLSQMR